MRKNLNAGSGLAYSRSKSVDPAWAEAEDKMTDAQAASLKALAEEAGEPDAFDQAISKAEASLRIHALRAKIHHERNRFL